MVMTFGERYLESKPLARSTIAIKNKSEREPRSSLFLLIQALFQKIRQPHSEHLMWLRITSAKQLLVQAEYTPSVHIELILLGEFCGFISVKRLPNKHPQMPHKEIYGSVHVLPFKIHAVFFVIYRCEALVKHRSGIGMHCRYRTLTAEFAE